MYSEIKAGFAYMKLCLKYFFKKNVFPGPKKKGSAGNERYLYLHPEYNSQGPNGGGRELTPASSFLTSTHTQ